MPSRGSSRPSPPEPQELEVSVFGPGFGECVVLHLGFMGRNAFPVGRLRNRWASRCHVRAEAKSQTTTAGHHRGPQKWPIQDNQRLGAGTTGTTNSNGSRGRPVGAQNAVSEAPAWTSSGLSWRGFGPEKKGLQSAAPSEPWRRALRETLARTKGERAITPPECRSHWPRRASATSRLDL